MEKKYVGIFGKVAVGLDTIVSLHMIQTYIDQGQNYRTVVTRMNKCLYIIRQYQLWMKKLRDRMRVLLNKSQEKRDLVLLQDLFLERK
jgi:hypothetical protein